MEKENKKDKIVEYDYSDIIIDEPGFVIMEEENNNNGCGKGDDLIVNPLFLYTILFCILGILLIGTLSFVSAFDPQLHNCFGDQELVICPTPSDPELIWLAGESPPEEPPQGGGGGWVTPPGEVYTQISFDIFGTNTGDYPVTDIQIINAIPIEFKEALPLNIITFLEVGDTDKLLWASELIEVEPLIAYPQPITFWLNVSGTIEGNIFYEQASIDVTIEPYYLEEGEGVTPGFAVSFPDLSFLEEGGFTKEDTLIIRGILTAITFFLIIYFVKRRKKKKRTKKEKEEEGVLIPTQGLRQKEKKSNLTDTLIIVGIIIFILLILLIPVKEEIETRIGTKIVVHYYKDGVEVKTPTSNALSSQFYRTQEET